MYHKLNTMYIIKNFSIFDMLGIFVEGFEIAILSINTYYVTDTL